MLLTSLASLAIAAASPVQGPSCPTDLHADIRGIVTGIALTPAAPFDGIAIGDDLTLSLSFANDVFCTTASGLNGFLATPFCCELSVGTASSGLDPMPDPCVWGESYSPSGPLHTQTVESGAPFASGQVIARLRVTDPNGLVGIGIFDLLGETIDIPSVTASGFSATLELVDTTGAWLATVDPLELQGYGGSAGGFPYCFSNANSTGAPARMSFQGSSHISDNDLTFHATDLPQHTFVLFLAGMTQGQITVLPGSAGVLCLSGNIGRFFGPGQIQPTLTGSEVSLPIDLTRMPLGTGLVAVQPGETWNFTCWYRDITGTTTNNFAHGYSVLFF